MAVNINELKVGDVVIAGDGHGCLQYGQECKVVGINDKEPWVKCAEGEHFLWDYGNGMDTGFTKK